MKIHALVEGASEKAFLDRWAERFLKGHELRVYPHQGKGTLPNQSKQQDSRKRGLLDQLPGKLAAFGQALDPSLDRVLVLIDADDDDWMQLAQQLEELLAALDSRPNVFFGFPVEELEAFYLGDLKALATAFPEFNRELAAKYTPDSVCGTWELFGQVVSDGGGNKVAWAEAMGKVLTTKPEESRSPSFRTFCRGLRQLSTPSVQPRVARPKPRKARAATSRDVSGRRRR
jgi:hypothetical protein